MAAILNNNGNGGEGAGLGLGGGMGQLPLEQWFFEMPICTRWWTTATIVTGVLVQCQILTPFQLFYSFRAVWHKQQVCLSTLSGIQGKKRKRSMDHENVGNE
jgi:Derlin-2/3